MAVRIRIRSRRAVLTRLSRRLPYCCSMPPLLRWVVRSKKHLRLDQKGVWSFIKLPPRLPYFPAFLFFARTRLNRTPKKSKVAWPSFGTDFYLF